MPKAIMLVGLPASSKSTYANELSTQVNAAILSSDAMREELYGDINHQDNNGDVFQELYRRAKEHLKNGKSVILDATNISSKRRIAVVNEFKDYELECHYFDVPLDICWERDRKRERSVGFDVINRMYKGMQIPTVKEGWNAVKFIHHYTKPQNISAKEYLESVITVDQSYRSLFTEDLETLDIFHFITDLPHDSSYHSLSVSRHTYYVWKHIIDNYHAGDKLTMLWVALLHDVGKHWCKNFKDGSRYANFISHENVGSQLACNFLSWLGYDDEFVSEVVELVQLHMRLLQIEENSDACNKLRLFVGDDTFHKLVVLRAADVGAH